MYAPTPDGVWFVKVRCGCGARMDASGMTFPVVETFIDVFVDRHQNHGVTVEVRRHWKRSTNTDDEIKTVEIPTTRADVDQDFAGQFCECGHDPHTGICGAAEGWDGGAPAGFCECPSYRPDPEDPGP